MKEQSTQPTYFALALASFLLAIVLLFNMLSPMAVPVTREQFDQIREADLIEYLIVQPRGFTWQLIRVVRVQGTNGETVAKRIELADPDPTVAEDWQQKGGAVRQEQDTSWWGGVVFIALLLGVGGMAHLVPNTARYQRGRGASPPLARLGNRAQTRQNYPSRIPTAGRAALGRVVRIYDEYYSRSRRKSHWKNSRW